MIKTKKDLKRVLLFEKEKYHLKKFHSLRRVLNICERSSIWHFQKLLRKTEYHLNAHHLLRSKFYGFRKRCFGEKIGFSIPVNCFEEGLVIMHTGRILINKNARVGKNCMLHCNTYLVATNGVTDSPTLGDDCKIGVGAILIGGIHIADGIAIGAGSVVTKSFEEKNITIAGNPAKKISDKGVM